MIDVQITTPVLPGSRMKTKLEKTIKAVVKDEVCNINFYLEGKDFYGQTNFQILVMDASKHELDDLRNKILAEILTMLIGK